ncbi:uncharacterized protein LOC126904639 [Daktulosphaira vitifoliae]|uniref:uncharacterized protein LOC126904639 n=1 Tax=Daktulosphaira vitifoliae TaxID=58002 RepID=UPI0021A9C55D|nr:uncharacterized protein LOC126904639 [Daktulosphaira vitifoliae]
MSWCLNQMRRAYNFCKRHFSCQRNIETNQDDNLQQNVPGFRRGIRNETVNGQMESRPATSLQKPRPDIPTVKRLTVDPVKAAAVFKACKELRVVPSEEKTPIVIKTAINSEEIVPSSISNDSPSKDS